jgi:hypothetical protein
MVNVSTLGTGTGFSQEPDYHEEYNYTKPLLDRLSLIQIITVSVKRVSGFCPFQFQQYLFGHLGHSQCHHFEFTLLILTMKFEETLFGW